MLHSANPHHIGFASAAVFSLETLKPPLSDIPRSHCYGTTASSVGYECPSPSTNAVR
jgi:hypothetical protein